MVMNSDAVSEVHGKDVAFLYSMWQAFVCMGHAWYMTGGLWLHCFASV